MFFFFKQKTAYEMRISDWSSDVCSSDLDAARDAERLRVARELHDVAGHKLTALTLNLRALAADPQLGAREAVLRSEEHTSELQSLMRTSYAVFCLKKNRKGSERETTQRSEKRKRTQTKDRQ